MRLTSQCRRESAKNYVFDIELALEEPCLCTLFTIDKAFDISHKVLRGVFSKESSYGYARCANLFLAKGYAVSVRFYISSLQPLHFCGQIEAQQ